MDKRARMCEKHEEPRRIIKFSPSKSYYPLIGRQDVNNRSRITARSRASSFLNEIQPAIILMASISLGVCLLLQYVQAEHAVSEIWSELDGLQMKYMTDHDDIMKIKAAGSDNNEQQAQRTGSEASGEAQGGSDSESNSDSRESQSSAQEGNDSSKSDNDDDDKDSMSEKRAIDEQGADSRRQNLVDRNIHPSSPQSDAVNSPAREESNEDRQRDQTRLPHSKFTDYTATFKNSNIDDFADTKESNSNDLSSVDNGSDEAQQSNQGSVAAKMRSPGRLFQAAVRHQQEEGENAKGNEEAPSVSSSNNNNEESSNSGSASESDNDSDGSDNGEENSNENANRENRKSTGESAETKQSNVDENDSPVDSNSSAQSDDQPASPRDEHSGPEPASGRGLFKPHQSMIDFERVLEQRPQIGMANAVNVDESDGELRDSSRRSPISQNILTSQNFRSVDSTGEIHLHQHYHPHPSGKFDSFFEQSEQQQVSSHGQRSPTESSRAYGSSKYPQANRITAASRPTPGKVPTFVSGMEDSSKPNDSPKPLSYFKEVTNKQKSTGNRAEPSIKRANSDKNPKKMRVDTQEESPDSVRDDFISPGHFPGSMPHLTQAASEPKGKLLLDQTLISAPSSTSTSSLPAPSDKKTKPDSSSQKSIQQLAELTDKKVESFMSEYQSTKTVVDKNIGVRIVPNDGKLSVMLVTQTPDNLTESGQVMAPILTPTTTTTVAPRLATTTHLPDSDLELAAGNSTIARTTNSPAVKRFKFRKLR